MRSVLLRQLLTTEAFPPGKDPVECRGCRRTDMKVAPLFLATPLMGREFITCRPCFNIGKSTR